MYEKMAMNQIDPRPTTPPADAIQVGGSHYKDMPIQPWDIMEAVMTHEEFVGFLKGNLIKYCLRTGKKENSDDAAKAKHYMQKLTEITARNRGNW